MYLSFSPAAFSTEFGSPPIDDSLCPPCPVDPCACPPRGSPPGCQRYCAIPQIQFECAKRKCDIP